MVYSQPSLFWRIVPVLFFLLAAGLISLQGCRPEPEKEAVVLQQDSIPFLDLDSIRKRGKLRALTDYSSTSYFLYKGLPMGYEYDLLQTFASHLDLELEVVIVEDLDSIFAMLNRGEGDIVAANMTVTKERSEFVDFSERLLTTRQILIQRLPENHHRMMRHQTERLLIRNQLDLIGHEVVVRKNSSFYSRLKALSNEIGGEILIREAPGDVETEQLIELVSKGEIDYTVADENVARLNKIYYPNIDIQTNVSFPQQIAWAIRKNNPKLQDTLNQWVLNNRHSSDFATIYAKYFRSRRAHRDRVKSDFSSLSGGKISIYDDLIKQYSTLVEWDWRLVAALIYQESRFDFEAESWMGARGLMQILPETAAMIGVDSIKTSEDNLKAGILYLKKLEDIWKTRTPGNPDLNKLVLASYNVGLGHIIDAQRLAEKYEEDQNSWEVISRYLMLKSRPAYYNDEVVKHGYCRGSEPVKYVREILNRYDQYKNVIE